METIRLRYNGPTPRTFPLPIPFVARSEQCGEVTCDPEGDFPVASAEHLLSLGTEVFTRVDEVPSGRGAEAGQAVEAAAASPSAVVALPDVHDLITDTSIRPNFPSRRMADMHRKTRHRAPACTVQCNNGNWYVLTKQELNDARRNGTLPTG